MVQLEGGVYIKARCKECEPPVATPQLPEGHIMGWKGEEVFPEVKWEEAGTGEEEEVVKGQ